MSTSDLKFSRNFALFLGFILLGAGIVLFLGYNGGTFEEKLGLVLFTCGALFVGIGYTLFVALKTR